MTNINAFLVETIDLLVRLELGLVEASSEIVGKQRNTVGQAVKVSIRNEYIEKVGG